LGIYFHYFVYYIYADYIKHDRRVGHECQPREARESILEDQPP
jgi:hypothetical protein